MAKSKIFGLLLVAICLTLLVGTFVGCNNQDDESTMHALNAYLQGGEVQVERSFCQDNDATVVLAKSQTIEDTLRKDTINSIAFCYARQTQLLVVKDSQVYTLKDAYLNLLLDSAKLREIQTTYNQTFELESGAEYTEIGNAIVLEEKLTRDYDTLEEWKIAKDTLLVSIDKSFNYYRFDEKDFAMIDIQSVSCLTEYGYDWYQDGYPETFRHIYCLTLNNSGFENVINAIKTLEKVDYIYNASPNYLGSLIW